MAEQYAAKKAYQDVNVATKYEDNRFRSLRGQFGHWVDRNALERILAKIDRSGRTLDLACGTGRISRILAHCSFRVFSSDVSFEMLSVAKEKQRPNEPMGGFCQAAGEELPFRDGAFELVTAVRFLGHLPPDVRRKVLSELARISKHHVILEISMTTPLADLRHWLRWSAESLTRKEIIEGTWQWHVFSRNEIETELQEAGLILEERSAKLRFLSDGWYYLLRVEHRRTDS